MNSTQEESCCYAPTFTTDLSLTVTSKEARVDTRLLAKKLGNQHHNTLALVIKHEVAFQKLGKVLFKTEPLSDSRTGQRERFALLNEDQAFFLLSLSRNTDLVVGLKLKLIESFGDYRRTAHLRQHEYLPSYHGLQDAIHLKSAESANQKMVHINVNKLVNRTVGIEAGQRALASMPKQAMLIVAQLVAARAMQSGHDHHDGYQRVKQSLQALADCAQLKVGHG